MGIPLSIKDLEFVNPIYNFTEFGDINSQISNVSDEEIVEEVCDMIEDVTEKSHDL